MTNRVNHYQTLRHLVGVYIVYPGLAVPVLRVNMVIRVFRSDIYVFFFCFFFFFIFKRQSETLFYNVRNHCLLLNFLLYMYTGNLFVA